MFGIFLTLCGLVLLVIADALKKKLAHNYDPVAVAVAMLMWAVPLTALYSFSEGVATFNFKTLLWCVPLSSVLYCVAELAFINAIRSSQLSLVLPLRVVGPVVALPFGVLLFGEVPGLLAIVGTVIILVGCYLLYLPECDFKHFFSPFSAIVQSRGARLILFSSIVFPLLIGLQRIGSAASSPMAFFSMAMTGELILFLLLQGRRKNLGELLATRVTTVMALLWTVGFALVMMAANYTYLLYITVVMQLAPLFSIPLAHMLFGEKTARRLWPTALMVSGVILLVIGAHM